MKHIFCIKTLLLPFLFISSFAIPNEPQITAEISYGEFIDKITILQIKSERISDKKKLVSIKKELSLLKKTLKRHINSNDELIFLINKLKEINETLWDIEDAIRDKERLKLFDEEFILLARSVYITNDQRCKIKRAINTLLGSTIQEEKSYAEYNPDLINVTKILHEQCPDKIDE